MPFIVLQGIIMFLCKKFIKIDIVIKKGGGIDPLKP